jgi:hypothetical protein
MPPIYSSAQISGNTIVWAGRDKKNNLKSIGTEENERSRLRRPIAGEYGIIQSISGSADFTNVTVRDTSFRRSIPGATQYSHLEAPFPFGTLAWAREAPHAHGCHIGCLFLGHQISRQQPA